MTRHTRRTVASAALAAIAVLYTSVVATGCSSLAPAREKIVQGVKAYCTTPLEERLAIRQAVNDGLQGAATIKVTCAGDPQ